MALVIQRNTPVPPRGYIKATAKKMKVGDMVVCPPAGKTHSNQYYSAVHGYLIELGRKARSEKVTLCAKCQTVKDKQKCVECGARRTVAMVRTWRIA